MALPQAEPAPESLTSRVQSADSAQVMDNGMIRPRGDAAAGWHRPAVNAIEMPHAETLVSSRANPARPANQQACAAGHAWYGQSGGFPLDRSADHKPARSQSGSGTRTYKAAGGVDGHCPGMGSAQSVAQHPRRARCSWSAATACSMSLSAWANSLCAKRDNRAG